MALIETLIMGIKSLNYSASEYGGEEEQLTTKDLVLTMGFALVLTVVLFIVLPGLFAALCAELYFLEHCLKLSGGPD